MAARAKRSKRPSAASSGSKPPEPLVFFIDRSLGRKIVAQALREIGETVEIHDDHFVPDAKDEDWLVEVGKRGWIVLTKDDRIRYRVTERMAIASAKVRAFVLTSSQLQGTEMAAAFVNALPRIKRILAGNASPFYWPGFKNWKSLAVVSSPPLLCKKYGAGPIARRDETVRRVGCPFNLSWATEVDETSRRVRVVRPELPRSLHRVAIGLLVALALL